MGLTSITFFSSVVPRRDMAERVIDPLRETVDRIEETIAFLQTTQITPCPSMLG